MTAAVYEPGYLNRRRRTKAEVDQLDRQIIEVLAEDHPQSVRHVFYRMTDPRLEEPVTKSDSGSPNGYRAVWSRLKELRRSGLIPYWWITDATRRGHHVATYSSGADFVRTNAAGYRANLWVQAEVYCEVWCESRSIAGVIEDDCRDLAVSLYPAGGFSSITLAYEAAEMIAEEVGESGKPVHIVYIGDYDPAGVLIDRSIETELRRHLPDHVDLTFHRLAITEEQIRDYDLPTKPRKPGDKRSPHVRATVEAEALPAAILRRMLRDKIESFLPVNALAVVKIVEENERRGLRSLAALMDAAPTPDMTPSLLHQHPLEALGAPLKAIRTLAEAYRRDGTAAALAANWPWESSLLTAARAFMGEVCRERWRIEADEGPPP